MALSKSEEARLDRAVGAVVGMAVGDALGAGLEFTRPRAADQSNWITELVGGGPFGWGPGDTTDDTAMAKCVIDMYLKNNGRYSQRYLIENFLTWYRSMPKDIGGWTRFALRTWDKIGAPPYVKSESPYGEAVRDKHPIFHDWARFGGSHASNGGVMRCIPTALVDAPTATLLSDAARICMDTHPAPACVMSCQVVVLMAARMIREMADPKSGEMRGRGKRSYTMADLWLETMRMALVEENSEVYRALRMAPTHPWAHWQNGGSTVDTTLCALAALFQAKSFEKGLLAVVNRGGDADTVGAVAGGLLGARFGYKAIPKRWLDQLVGHEELRKNAIDLWLIRRNQG